MAQNQLTLSERVREAQTRRKAKGKKKRPKPTPMVDRSVEKAVKDSQVQITGALRVGFKNLESLLQKLLKRPETPQISPEILKQAVAEGIANMPEQKITFPAREPVAYRATIERRGKEMTGALIEPVKNK